MADKLTDYATFEGIVVGIERKRQNEKKPEEITSIWLKIDGATHGIPDSQETWSRTRFVQVFPPYFEMIEDVKRGTLIRIGMWENSGRGKYFGKNTWVLFDRTTPIGDTSELDRISPQYRVNRWLKRPQNPSQPSPTDVNSIEENASKPPLIPIKDVREGTYLFFGRDDDKYYEYQQLLSAKMKETDIDKKELITKKMEEIVKNRWIEIENDFDVYLH